MHKTGIEYVVNPDGSPGYTSNPFTGCLNGCPYCYAKRESFGRCKHADLAGIPIEPGHDDDPFFPRFHPERLDQIKARKEPCGIFLCNRSDYAASYWPEEWRSQLFDTIRACPWHRFYLLTKQAQELPKFSPFPPNYWVGVTVTTQGQYNQAIVSLRNTEAKLKYLSIEPLLSKITILHPEILAEIDWPIIGACTGTEGEMEKLQNEYQSLSVMPYGTKWTAQPPIEWVQEIVEAGDKAGVPVFLKNNLEPLWTLENRREPFFKFTRPSPGATEIGNLRQEMPQPR